MRKNRSEEYKNVVVLFDQWKLDEGEDLLSKYDLSIEEKTELNELYLKRVEQKGKLDELESYAKKVIHDGDITQLSRYIKKGLINDKKLKSISELDVQGARVYFGKREFFRDKIEMIMVINYYEENLYVDLQLEYKNEEWQIESFSERR